MTAAATGGCPPGALPTDASEAAALDELRQRFGELLGEGAEVSEEAFRAAVDDPVYARHLLGSRGASHAVRMLLDAPPQLERDPEPSAGALALRASKALTRWAAAGFATVDDATLQRRLAACEACEHLKQPAERRLERLAGRGLTDQSSCGLCGCPVQRKAKLSTERCPAPHPTLAGLSRWSDGPA